MIKPFQGTYPQIAPNAFITENATIIGQVTIGEASSVWYNAILRGDVDAIHIGQRTNLQDAVIAHCTTNRCPTIVGNEVTVGHAAILHGCTIADQVLIGMGAKVLDEAIVPSHCVVAAGALVLERQELAAGYLYAGVPARKVKALTQAQIAGIQQSALHYVENARLHREISG